jgi:hypothetical protein
MKTLILAIALVMASSAYAQTIRCVQNLDGSVTCRTARGF